MTVYEKILGYLAIRGQGRQVPFLEKAAALGL